MVQVMKNHKSLGLHITTTNGINDLQNQTLTQI